MPTIETRLLMTFKTNEDKKMSLYISDPKQDLTESQIKSAMDLIVEKNIFAPNFGVELVSPVDAKIVTTDTTEYDLVIS